MAFTDSRRLTGPNVYFDRPAAALEALSKSVDDAQIVRWQSHVGSIASALHWPKPEFHVKRHAKGASLAFTASTTA